MAEGPGDAALAATGFGGLLRACRERGLLSQERLAQRSGLSVRTVRDLEAGRVGQPRGASVRLLADALGLVGWERDRFDEAARAPRSAGPLRAVDVAPVASNLGVGLIDLPASPDGVAAGPGGLGQQRREALDPAVDGGVVDLDATLGEQLLDIAVGQREAQVPPHRQHDHVWWKQKPAKADRVRGAEQRR
jgi:transcriptional regulator with XRE-family HTH domain